MNIINSYTLETSFYGYKNKGVNQAFTEKDFFSIGENLLKSIFGLMDYVPEVTQIPKLIS